MIGGKLPDLKHGLPASWYKQTPSTKDPTCTPYCGACPQKKESMSSKRYIGIVVELMIAHGLWRIKPYELPYHETRHQTPSKQMQRCQKHSSLIHQPAEPLTTMLSPCPFTQRGVDIVGPFSVAFGQRKFLLVTIDYFTKWVEVEPLARITEREVKKFIWKNIMYRFGIPREIISDNGRQF
ncbi:UNVERIFIED_CONTAM: hypothetical protein Sradi_3150900 [Sesamum radiatum]|uniref:Integrase catalytic domain-containing protein n=1 Tax=Sesamum radiatum TaxID=300843 RepID=A0AAW2REI7_SESRA